MRYFLGDLSPFQVITSLVAFITGGYTFYKSFVERAKLAFFPTRSVQLVAPTDEGPLRFRLSGSLSNSGVRLGVLEDLAARVTDPRGNILEFRWQGLIREVSESLATHVSPASALGVPPRSTRPLNIELVAESGPARWCEGKYSIALSGWVNRHRSKPPNLTARLEATLTDLDVFVLGPSSQKIISIPIELAT